MPKRAEQLKSSSIRHGPLARDGNGAAWHRDNDGWQAAAIFSGTFRLAASARFPVSPSRDGPPPSFQRSRPPRTCRSRSARGGPGTGAAADPRARRDLPPGARPRPQPHRAAGHHGCAQIVRRIQRHPGGNGCPGRRKLATFGVRLSVWRPACAHRSARSQGPGGKRRQPDRHPQSSPQLRATSERGKKASAWPEPLGKAVTL